MTVQDAVPLQHDASAQGAVTVQFVRDRDVLWRRLDTGVVLLRRDDREVVTLSGSGQALWDVLAHPTTIPQAAQRLSDAFEVPADRVAGDLDTLIRQLESRRLVQRMTA